MRACLRACTALKQEEGRSADRLTLTDQQGVGLTTLVDYCLATWETTSKPTGPARLFKWEKTDNAVRAQVLLICYDYYGSVDTLEWPSDVSPGTPIGASIWGTCLLAASSADALLADIQQVTTRQDS